MHSLKAIFSAPTRSKGGGTGLNNIRLHGQLALKVGDLLEAEFIGEDAGLQLLRIGGKVLKATGLPHVEAGERLFFRVEAMGPPLRLRLLGQVSPGDGDHGTSELLKVRVEFLGVKDSKDAWSRLLRAASLDLAPPGPFASKARRNLECLLKAILARQALSPPSSKTGSATTHEVERGQGDFSRLLRGLEGIFALEARLGSDSTPGLPLLLPLFFDGGMGHGLLAIYRKREEEQGGGKGREGGQWALGATVVEFDLFMSELGPVRIYSSFKSNGLDLFIRVRPDVAGLVEKGLQDLRGRISGLGMEVRGMEVATAGEAAPVGQGLFDRLENGSSLHIVA